VDGVPVVAGGAIGERGAVIVDDVENPARIVGVADGSGGLLRQPSEFAENLRRVTEAINRKRIQPQV